MQGLQHKCSAGISLLTAFLLTSMLPLFGMQSEVTAAKDPVNLLSGETISKTIGTLPAGDSLLISFDVTVDGSLSPSVTEVANQGTVSGGNFTSVLTDDPDAPGAADPTVTPISQADIGVIAINSPQTDCGLSGSEPVTITIQNFSSADQSGFDVTYMISGPINATATETVASTVTGSGGTLIYNFTTSADLSATGTYTVKAFTALAGDADLSNDTTTVSVVNAPPLIADAGTDKSVDAGSPVVLGGSPSAMGGTPPYSYSWSPNAGLNDPSLANPIATANQATTYTLTVTDATGCTATDEVEVKIRRWLYAVSDEGPNQLTRIDLNDPLGTLTVVANYITFAGPGGMGLAIGAQISETEAATLDVTNDIAYIILNLSNDSVLMTLDLTNGEATGIGYTGVEDINALAYDPINNLLYGVSSKNRRLYEINPATGVATAKPNLITTSNSNIEGLEFDHFATPPVLYAVDENSGAVYTIDTFSGIGTLVGVTNPTFEALEFGSDGTMYAASNLGTIYVIDRTTYAASFLADGLVMDGEGLILKDAAATLDDLTPVELTSFEAQSWSSKATLTWKTASETENLGFHIFRSETEHGNYVLISSALVPGNGNSADAHEYIFADHSATPGNQYWYKLADVDYQGNMDFHGPVAVTIITGVAEAQELPADFKLLQNYPNPFNPTTTITFEIPEPADVQLSIYNTAGQLVRQLTSGQFNAGRHALIWDARDSHGHQAATGVYIYMLKAGNFVAKRKLLLMK